MQQQIILQLQWSPAFNGVDMVFARAAQTGCRSLYVLNNSDIKSTKDLVGKEVAIIWWWYWRT